MAQKFLIAPLKDTGLQTDREPWLIPDEAFARLNNAYIFRGRVRKRFGSRSMDTTGDPISWQLKTRLRVQVNPASSGNPSGNVRTFTNAPNMATGIGQLFSIGNDIFTVISNTPGPQPMLRSDGVVATATYDVTTSAYNITNAQAGPPVYFYPNLPVMGIDSYEDPAINNEKTFAFDTTFAYQYIPGGWERLTAAVSPADAVWTGDNADFFWCHNWRGASAASYLLFVTNNKIDTLSANTDNIRYWDGTQWTTFNFPIDSSTNVIGARIIVSYKSRLVLLNVTEMPTAGGATTTYKNRARWSQVAIL